MCAFWADLNFLLPAWHSKQPRTTVPPVPPFCRMSPHPPLLQAHGRPEGPTRACFFQLSFFLLSIIFLIIIPHPWKPAQIFVCALLTCILQSTVLWSALWQQPRFTDTKKQCTCQQWHLRESSPKSMVTAHQCVCVSAQKECYDHLQASTQESTESIRTTALLSWPGFTRASQRASQCLRVEKFHMRPLLLTSSWSLFLRRWPHTQHLQIDAVLRLHPLTSVTVWTSPFYCKAGEYDKISGEDRNVATVFDKLASMM